jgi:FkbM family methyltransferase
MPDRGRATGGAADRVRTAWRRLVADRWPAADRAAHRAYGELERWIFAVTVMADAPSYRRFRRLDSPRRGARRGAPVNVSLRPLGGRSVVLRPGTSDALMLRETFRDGVYAPPPEAEARGIRQIVDLGANIGITAAANAHRYPGAHVLAVELDAENAALAERNVAPWRDRVEILVGAVWTHDGEVRYERPTGEEFGFRVVERGGTHVAPAYSLATILDRVPGGARVDFLKMDVEGAERHLLSAGAAAWAARVDAIALQVHGSYSLADALRDLEALGFSARIDRRAADYVAGVRRP